MARLQATPSSRCTATAPEPGRGEHFITSIVAFTQGPSIPQVPLVTADQQILFAQMAHLSLGVTLTSCLLVPAIDNVLPNFFNQITLHRVQNLTSLEQVGRDAVRTQARESPVDSCPDGHTVPRNRFADRAGDRMSCAGTARPGSLSVVGTMATGRILPRRSPAGPCAAGDLARAMPGRDCHAPVVRQRPRERGFRAGQGPRGACLSGERVAFESLSQLPFPIASRLDRPPRRGSAP